MRLAIFFGLLAIICPAFGAKVNKSVSDSVPKNLVSECELSFPKSEVIVNSQNIPVEEDHQESIQSLTVLARKFNTAHSDEYYSLGLTTTELFWGLDAEFMSLQLDGLDMHCARPKIKISLKVKYHKVRIAKELSPQSCEYNFVHDHEYEHVNINNENMQHYAKEVTIAFNKKFPNNILYGPIDQVNSEMKKAMDNEWLPFIKEITAKMEAEGMKRHEAIDTPEEYAKANTACSGKISTIIQAIKKIM